MALTVTASAVGRPKSSVEIQETAVAFNAVRVVTVAGVLTSDPSHPTTTKAPSPSASGLIFISSCPPLADPAAQRPERNLLAISLPRTNAEHQSTAKILCGVPLSAR